MCIATPAIKATLKSSQAKVVKFTMKWMKTFDDGYVM